LDQNIQAIKNNLTSKQRLPPRGHASQQKAWQQRLALSSDEDEAEILALHKKTSSRASSPGGPIHPSGNRSASNLSANNKGLMVEQKQALRDRYQEYKDFKTLQKYKKVDIKNVNKVLMDQVYD